MLGCRGCATPTSPTLTKLPQELPRWNVEGIALEHAADDDHGVRPHNVNHGVTAKLPEMVGANDCVVVMTPHLVYTRFKLNDIVDTRAILDGPVHTTTNAT